MKITLEGIDALTPLQAEALAVAAYLVLKNRLLKPKLLLRLEEALGKLSSASGYDLALLELLAAADPKKAAL